MNFVAKVVSAALLAPALAFSTELDDAILSGRRSDSVVSRSVPVSESTWMELQALDPELIPAGVERHQVLEVEPEVAEAAMDRMVAARWASMDFLAHPYFRSSSVLLYFPPQTVASLYRNFEISTVFFSHGKTRRDHGSGEKMVAKDSLFQIQGILIGRGRIAVLYPFHVSVHRDDPFYGFLTGNYELYRVNVADIESSEAEGLVLANLRGRDSGSEAFRAIQGPLGVGLHRLTVPPTETKVYVKAGAAHWEFEHPAFRKVQASGRSRFMSVLLGDNRP